MDKLRKAYTKSDSIDRYYIRLRIEELLYEFYKSYNKLEKELGFNEIIEYFIFYMFMYRKGFLSIDQKFEFSIPRASEYEEFDHNGFMIFTGTGVCRNISILYCDLLLSKNIEAADLIIRYPKITDFEEFYVENKADINLQRKISIETSINLYSEDNVKEKLQKLLAEKSVTELKNIDYRITQGVINDKAKRILGDHEITSVTNSNGKTLYLDTTNGLYFTRRNGNLLLGDMKFKIMKLSTFASNITFLTKNEAKLLFKTFFSNNTFDINNNEFDNKAIEVLKTISDNMNMISKFYFDNLELYKEINNYAQHMKVRTMKKEDL